MLEDKFVVPRVLVKHGQIIARNNNSRLQPRGICDAIFVRVPLALEG